MTETIDDEVAEQYREAFLAVFDPGELNENSDEVFEEEVFPFAPDDITLQKVIASYDTGPVWLLTEDGPVQAFYDEDESWGETGSAEDVADEIMEAMGSVK